MIGRTLAALVSALVLLQAPVRGDAIDDAAPVLGRILDKNLGESGVHLTALQWVRLEGRGVLYIGGVNLLHLRPDDVEATSGDDLIWENAHREALGQAPVQPKEDSRTRTALDTVRDTLGKFGSRIPVPAGEAVRVALYADTSSCRSCHQDPAAAPAARGFNLFAEDPTNVPHTQVLDLAVQAHLGARRDVVVVSARGVEDRGSVERDSDSAVLARVIGKRLRATFPDEFWGVDTRQRPGAIGFSAGDWGSIVVLNMTFPLGGELKLAVSTKNDIWEQTLRELRGEISTEKGTLSVTAIDADQLLSTIKGTLVDFSARVRDLDASQEIAVLIYSGGHRHTRTLTLRTAPATGGEPNTVLIFPAGSDPNAGSAFANSVQLPLHTTPVAEAPRYILRAGPEFLERQRSGARRDELLDGIQVE